ncbi:energy-coupling factor ABC transporter permease [Planctomycetales bacterium ZRK34]|nr:energy-coupling factor ABC transporter permease [Planctomycetales bacterium ZRK34]
MHLGNNVVTPECAVFGLGMAALGLGAGVVMARRTGKVNPLRYGAATSLVFALQMFNLPVMPQASGHMIGGFLLANWFGPGWGLIGMALLLSVQSVFYADGGLTVLGLNILTMGVAPCLIAYPLWKRWCGQATGAARWASLAAGAWASVMLAAVICTAAVFSVASAQQQPGSVIGMMFGVHAIIGVIEAALTVAVMALVEKTKPMGAISGAAGVTATSLVVALAAFFGASPWPDGLEFSLERCGIAPLASSFVESIEQWQASLAIWPDYSSVTGALMGVVILLSIAALAARVLGPQRDVSLKARFA